ncbi:hypothetical protein BGZ95_011455, partial [Linnemannia exigua]
MNYSSRIRRALAKTLSGHALPIPRSIKRVTFNDTVQFHTTTGRFRTRFSSNEDEDDEEEEDGASSSPVLRFFSAGFSASAAGGLSPEEPMSSSPSPATPITTTAAAVTGQRKKNRPPSIMPSARDRKQLQEQDDLEAQGSAGGREPGISVVSNGRSISVSTTALTSGAGASTVAKKLVSTITIALPPLSRPRKQQQQQQPISPAMTIAATSTTSAAGAATTSTTTTNM